jgi:hypothetical protein
MDASARPDLAKTPLLLTMQHSSKCCKRRRNALKNCETRT